MKNKKLKSTLLLFVMIASIMCGNTEVVTKAADTGCTENTCGGEPIVGYVSDIKTSKTSEFEYEYSKTEVTITKYIGSGKDVKIPSEIDGIKVTAIGQAAFKDNGTVESIEVSENVSTIYRDAFNSCSKLKNVILPEGLKYMDHELFANCNSLNEIKIPSTVVSMGYNMFYNCTALEEIKIPSGVTDIGIDFAAGCTSLTNVEIPDTVTIIRPGAFSGCTALRTINIPSSVETIQAPFQDLKQIIIIGEKGSKAEEFAGLAGHTFSAVGTQITDKESRNEDFEYIANSSEVEILKYIGSESEVKIPETINNLKVTSIGFEAFKGNENIKSIVIQDGVEIVNKGSFSGCTNLEKVTMPDSVTKIKAETFKDCKNLKDINLSLNLEAVEYKAFQGCDSLETILIPKNVLCLDYDIFDNCKSLKEINVKPGNKQYSSRQGILYGGSSLLKCPEGYEKEKLELENDVNYIRFNAFSNCINTKVLIIDGKEINISEIVDEIVDKIKNANSNNTEINGVLNFQISIEAIKAAAEASASSDTQIELTFNIYDCESGKVVVIDKKNNSIDESKIDENLNNSDKVQEVLEKAKQKVKAKEQKSIDGDKVINTGLNIIQSNLSDNSENNVLKTVDKQKNIPINIKKDDNIKTLSEYKNSDNNQSSNEFVSLAKTNEAKNIFWLVSIITVVGATALKCINYIVSRKNRVNY